MLLLKNITAFWSVKQFLQKKQSKECRVVLWNCNSITGYKLFHCFFFSQLNILKLVDEIGVSIASTQLELST